MLLTGAGKYVHYIGRKDVERLLGKGGKRVLGHVLDRIATVSGSQQWPLERVEVRHTQDPEIAGWEYALVVLVFNCTFEEADEHLHALYEHLDSLVARLTEEEQERFRRLLYFDIETPAAVSAS